MSKDISPILEGWDYRPDEISVRKIRGLDGKVKIQLRLDLGLLQMETEGRPDGQRPHGKESLLEYYLSLIEEHRAKYGTDENFQLDSEDCARLRREATQYYHRYISLLQLGEHEGVVQDTERNLRVFDLVKKYAVKHSDIQAFEPYRPYVIMINTRAKTAICLERKDYDGALREIETGIKRLEDFFREHNLEHLIEASNEVAFLRDWAQRIREEQPLTLKQKLERQMRLAIEKQDYERAAELRDRIRKLSESQPEV